MYYHHIIADITCNLHVGRSFRRITDAGSRSTHRCCCWCWCCCFCCCGNFLTSSSLFACPCLCLQSTIIDKYVGTKWIDKSLTLFHPTLATECFQSLAIRLPGSSIYNIDTGWRVLSSSCSSFMRLQGNFLNCCN